MNRDELDRAMRQCLREHLELAPKEGELDLSVELVHMGLDSMAMVALFLDLEKTLEIEIPNGLILDGTFKTGQSLKESLERLVLEEGDGDS